MWFSIIHFLLVALFNGFTVTTSASMKTSTNLIQVRGKSQDLNDWKAPDFIQREYRYYFSGNDLEDCPVWVIEFGHWNFRKAVEFGYDKELSIYADQSFKRIENSATVLRNKSSDDTDPGTFTVILDMDGLDVSQVTNLKTLQFVLKKLGDFSSFARHMEKGFIINANYPATLLMNAARPVLQSILGRIDIYGTQKEKWIPALLELIPETSLPPWYGGTKAHRPLKVYG